MKTKKDIIHIIQHDKSMMRTLENVRSLNLPECWIGAGFVRSKVWDSLHNYSNQTPLGDVDVIYFDPNDTDETTEKKLEERLKKIDPSVPWSVKNQARMHILANEPAYSSTEHALSLWPETATAVAVRLNEDTSVELLAPLGILDLVTMVVNPTPHWREKPDAYEARLARKNWHAKWPMLTVNHLQ